MCANFVFAHESPIDHIERELQLWADGGQLHLSYRVQPTERSVLMQLHQMDTNVDGVISDAESEKFFTAQAAWIADMLMLELDGRSLKFTPEGEVRRDARLGHTFQFAAPLGVLQTGSHTGCLVDAYSQAFPGPFRWHDAGERNAKTTRVQLTTTTGEQQPSSHPAGLELKFQLIVPE